MIKKFAMAAIAAASAALTIAPASADPFRIIVTSTEVPLVPNSVLYLAESEGYFERAGVDVELVPAAQTPMAVTALLTGSGEMANISTEALLGLHIRGDTSLVAIGSTDKAIPYIIAARDGTTFESLGTGTFGVGRENSLDYSLSRMVLASQGTKIEDMNYVPLGDPAVRAQVLRQGRVDATTMSIGVFLSMPERTGLNVLVDVDAFYRATPIVTKVNVVPRELLTKRGTELEAVLEALTLASRDFAAKPNLWVEAMKRARPDVDTATLTELSGLYARSWSVNGGLQAHETSYTANWYQDSGSLGGETMTPVRFWMKFEPMDAVLRKIGTSDLGDPVTR